MGNLTSLLFPLLILLLFIPIFLSGRKQRRQMAAMQSLQAALEPGDIVMTTSGLRATVVDVSYEDTIDLEIADGIVTTWVRAAVKEKVEPTVQDIEPAHEVETGHDTAPAVVDAPVEPVPSLEKAPAEPTPSPEPVPAEPAPSLEKTGSRKATADDTTTGTTPLV